MNYEIIINNYDSHSPIKIFIPSQLNHQDLDELGKKYCLSESSDLQVLELIKNWPRNNNFKISDKIRYFAKKEYNKKMEEFF